FLAVCPYRHYQGTGHGHLGQLAILGSSVNEPLKVSMVGNKLTWSVHADMVILAVYLAEAIDPQLQQLAFGTFGYMRGVQVFVCLPGIRVERERFAVDVA